tara:strand:- start:292 stop:636 length:345 start_codon:yes stop_codon:yes gene_type:complete
MAIGKSSAQNYTVVEAQNVALGQTGAAFTDTTDLYTPPSGSVIVAITMLTDVEFAALTPESTSFHYGTTAAAPGTNGATVANSDTFPKGVTIYGRWLSLDLQTAGDKVVIYFGP